jgi:hypothetical protein
MRMLMRQADERKCFIANASLVKLDEQPPSLFPVISTVYLRFVRVANELHFQLTHKVALRLVWYHLRRTTQHRGWGMTELDS